MSAGRDHRDDGVVDPWVSGQVMAVDDLLAHDPQADRWRLSEVEIRDLLQEIGFEPELLAPVLPVLLADITHGVPFEMRVGSWRLDLPSAIARGLVSGAVLTGALSALGEASIPAAVLGAIVPTIFDLQRVTLAPSEKYLYAVLLNAPLTASGQPASVEDWYRHLPARVQDEVTLLEFRDIIGKLEDAGTVDVDSRGRVDVDVPSTQRRVKLALPSGPSTGEYQQVH